MPLHSLRNHFLETVVSGNEFYRDGVYGVYIDIIILKVITIRHERITIRHKLGLKLDMSY